MRVILFAAAAVLAAYAPATAQVTRGDLADRESADRVERCADQFLGDPTEGPDHEIWIMCVQSVASADQRDPVRVAEYVVQRKRTDVFDAAGLDMSEDLKGRLQSGL